ncbi:MAG: 16S rRNA (guanine(527)-N(7))-methyltransferase RsmG [Solirubrobacteraceae bacterium]
MTAPERLHDLAARHRLGDAERTRLAALLELLATDVRAPSAVTASDEAVDIHVADSLSALGVSAVRDARRIADIGSGAGFPGLVLAIALPDAEVALVESNRRRCDFLERALTLTGAHNARVVCARAEAWPAGLGGQDLVTARAVGSLALLCEYAAPLLAVGGTLVAWKGTATDVERAAGDRAARELGLEPGAVLRTEPYTGSAGHHLHMYIKRADTPSSFPRRPGVARKRPLGVNP